MNSMLLRSCFPTFAREKVSTGTACNAVTGLQYNTSPSLIVVMVSGAKNLAAQFKQRYHSGIASLVRAKTINTFTVFGSSQSSGAV